jgi:hypothetical protein
MSDHTMRYNSQAGKTYHRAIPHSITLYGL